MRPGRLLVAALAVATACGDEPGGGAPEDTDASSGSTVGSTAPTSGSGETQNPDETGPAESGSSTSEETTGSGVCGEGSRCLAAPEEGWLGPVARFRGPPGVEPPPCGDGYPDGGFALYQGFIAPPPAECECSCSVHVSSVCSISMYPDTTSPSCVDFSVFIMNGAECTEYAIPNGSLYGQLYQLGTPSCVAADPVELPVVEWQADVHACSGVELGNGCGGGSGVCTPRPPGGYEDELCIFAQGDNECPAGPYSEKTLLFSSVRDDRGCTECECGTPPAIDCNGVFDLYDGSDCTGTVVGTAPSNGCSGAIVGAGSIHVNLVADTECGVATPSEPEGAAEPTGLFTYCCEG